jgi:uncharacterized protein (DUF58 family)
MAVSGLFGWANIRGLEAELLAPDEIYRGRGTLLTLRIVNRKRRLGSFLLRVEILKASLPVPLLAAGGEERISFTHTFMQRGLVRVADCAVVSPFPVNFFVRGVRADIATDVTVFPEPQSLQATGEAGRKGERGEFDTRRKGYEGEVARIADYSGAEPFRMIHWRLSARHDDLKVKEMTSLDAEPAVIDPELLPGDHLEVRLAGAAWLVNRLMRNNRPVGLKLSTGVIAPALSRSHRLRLLRELALYDQG